MNDDYDEGAFGKDNQSFRVQIDNVTSADPKYNLDNVSISGSVDNGSNFTSGQDNFTIAVLDNDQAGVVVSALDNQSAERGDNGTISIRLRSRPWGNVTVGFAADNSTRILADNASVTTGIYIVPDSLVFSTDNWSSTQTIEVVSFIDNISEGNAGADNQSFNFWLTSLDNSTDNDSHYDNDSMLMRYDPGNMMLDNISLASLDNDSSGLVVSMVDNFTAEDNASDNGTFFVRLTSRPHDNVTLTFKVNNVLDPNGKDPVDTEITFDNGSVVFSQSLVFGPSNWSDNQTVTFWAIDDQVDEDTQGHDNQTNTVFLDNITVINSDNDSHYVYHFLNNRNLNVDNLSLNVKDDDDAGLVMFWKDNDNTTSEAGGNAFMKVKLGSRPFLEDDTTLKIRLIIKDQTEAYFKDASWMGGVVFDPNLNLGDSTVIDDYQTGPIGFYMDYQFAAKDWDNGSVAMEVKGLDDSIDDNDTITYIYATIFSSTDPVYGASTFDPGDNLTFVNVDNETETLQLVLSSSSLNVSENGSQATFTLRLNHNPGSDLVISLSDNDSTEINLDNNTVTFTSGTDTIGPKYTSDGLKILLTSTGSWKTPQTVPLSGKDDNISDGSKTVQITLSGSGLTSDNVTVTVADNDSSGVMFHWVGGDNFTSEDNSSDKAIFTVRLTSAPFGGSDDNTSDNLTTAIVNLNVRGKDNRSVFFSADSLTFGSDNWSDAQRVTVTAVDDHYDEGVADNDSDSNNDNQTYTIFIDNITSTDSVYAAINAFASSSDMSTVVVEDNDVSGIGVEYVPVSGDNESFKIKFFLMSDPEDNVTLTLSAFDNSNVRFSDNGTADNGTSMTVNLTWADNASIYLTNASRNIDNESDDDDLFIDNLTIFSFYGTASCSRSTCDKYNNKQLAKTLIRNIQTGSVYTDFDNATQMPK